MTDLLHAEITQQILGAYFDVYNGLGHNYPEFIYENAMIRDVERRGVQCKRQDEYKVYYKGQLVGVQRLDIFAADEVVTELKVVPALTKIHKAQAFSYLKTTGKQVGLLLNFGGTSPQFERLFYQERTAHNQLEVLPSIWPDNWLKPALTHTIIGGLMEVHNKLGPGFIYRMYVNAASHELQLRGLEVMKRPVYEVIYRTHPVGAIKFEHLQVAHDVMIFPVAMQDIDDLSINNLKAWLRVQSIPLGVVANFYPDRLELKALRAD